MISSPHPRNELGNSPLMSCIQDKGVIEFGPEHGGGCLLEFVFVYRF